MAWHRLSEYDPLWGCVALGLAGPFLNLPLENRVGYLGEGLPSGPHRVGLTGEAQAQRARSSGVEGMALGVRAGSLGSWSPGGASPAGSQPKSLRKQGWQ